MIMVIDMWGTFRMESSMEKASILLPMVMSSKVNTIWVLNKAQVQHISRMAIFSLLSMLMVKKMEKGLWSILMAINSRVISRMERRMALVGMTTVMEESMKVVSKMVKEKGPGLKSQRKAIRRL